MNAQTHQEACDQCMKMLELIDELRQVGQPCEECSQPLVEGELYCITTVIQNSGKANYVTCLDCGAGACPNIKSSCDEFSDRLISHQAAELVDNYMAASQAPAPQRKLM